MYIQKIVMLTISLVIVQDLILKQLSKIALKTPATAKQRSHCLRTTNIMAKDICDGIASHFEGHQPKSMDSRVVASKLILIFDLLLVFG